MNLFRDKYKIPLTNKIIKEIIYRYIYGNILNILSMNNPNMSINDAIQTFINSCRGREKEGKIK